ncbi:Spy/CpxP family protein refolding chaperone [Rubinisphaera margarita]|uniref:Spy/CpxP family protein refolding chaperone n=1 Tax=Rubinisphaera margarita TaxID=2909586 RepID=UPI001EE8D000|nr:hypothetical protein [Rubinisphaera margarita]MCG6154281.1 hypothetical protein [Rubinisphaera margarita]
MFKKCSAVVPVCLAACLLASTAISQTMPARPDEGTRRSGNRLPNHYGKLGLSDEQREKIYSIQSDYRSKIQSLLQELEDLRDEQSLQIQSVLTETQRVELNKHLEEARQRRQTASNNR